MFHQHLHGVQNLFRLWVHVCCSHLITIFARILLVYQSKLSDRCLVFLHFVELLQEALDSMSFLEDFVASMVGANQPEKVYLPQMFKINQI